MNHSIDLNIYLPYEVETPWFAIGLIVQIEAEKPSQGVIMGIKLTGSVWSYLVCSDKLERWVSEDQVLPVDEGEEILYRQQWKISSKAIADEGYVFSIYDRCNELESGSLRFYDTPIAALIAGKAFLDREFPEAIEAVEQLGQREAA